MGLLPWDIFFLLMTLELASHLVFWGGYILSRLAKFRLSSIPRLISFYALFKGFFAYTLLRFFVRGIVSHFSIRQSWRDLTTRYKNPTWHLSSFSLISHVVVQQWGNHQSLILPLLSFSWHFASIFPRRPALIVARKGFKNVARHSDSPGWTWREHMVIWSAMANGEALIQSFWRSRLIATNCTPNSHAKSE